MKTKNTFFLTLLILTCFTAQAISPKSTKAKPPTPGLFAGFDLSYYHNSNSQTSSGKTTNTGPGSSFGITPTVQFPLSGIWAGSVGLNINTYNYSYKNDSYSDETKETEYGPVLSLYRYCKNPCDEDDWYSFLGFSTGYTMGSREFSSKNTMPSSSYKESGTISGFSAGFNGGAYYRMGGNFGVLGKVNLLSFSSDKTIYDKNNDSRYHSSSHFNLFGGASLGIYYQLGKKDK